MEQTEKEKQRRLPAVSFLHDICSPSGVFPADDGNESVDTRFSSGGRRQWETDLPYLRRGSGRMYDLFCICGKAVSTV